MTAAFNRGLLILGAGKNSIRFSPPLVLTREQADTAVRMFDEALTDVETDGPTSEAETRTQMNFVSASLIV